MSKNTFTDLFESIFSDKTTTDIFKNINKTEKYILVYYDSTAHQIGSINNVTAESINQHIVSKGLGPNDYAVFKGTVVKGFKDKPVKL